MQTVLFQHGLGGGEAQVAQNWPEKTAAKRITIPCRGHDETPIGTDRPFTIPMFAEDAMQALDKTPTFVAAGISMGAAISLYLACRHPQRVRALILVRPAWSFRFAPENMKPVAEIANLLKKHTPFEARRIFTDGQTAKRLTKESPDNLASLMSYTDHANATAFADILHDIAVRDPGINEADLAGIKAPCLVIANDNDSIHPVSCAKELANRIPNSQYIEVTPKSFAREQHQSEIRTAIAEFLIQNSEGPL